MADVASARKHTDDGHGYDQSLPLEWIQSPEGRDRASLSEFARGAVCGLSKKDDESFEAVHVSRIQRSFKRLGAPNLYKVGLTLLELLREVEPLFGGYWIPTPFRVVEIEGEFMFVGAVPNAHGLLGEMQVAGISRFVAKDFANCFPQQSLESWMGVAPQDTSEIVSSFTVNHADTAIKTSNFSDVNFLSLTAGGAGRYRTFQWSDRATEALAAEHIAICRQSHHGRTRYFSASMRNGKIVSEAPIHVDVSRLLFAIANYVDAPVKATIRSALLDIEITIGERLPLEEFRLALALSKALFRAGRSTKFVVPAKLAPALLTRLAALGCALERL